MILLSPQVYRDKEMQRVDPGSDGSLPETKCDPERSLCHATPLIYQVALGVGRGIVQTCDTYICLE
jgi:hypothetical protein